MAIGVNNSLENRSPNADFYYSAQPNSSMPWPTAEDAHNGIPPAFRAIGKMFMVGSVSNWKWYTYIGGITLAHLKPYTTPEDLIFDFLISEDGEATVKSKFNKIILSEDVELSVENPLPGMSGIVLVEQDEIGNRVVTLANGNIGNIPIDFTAGVITELIWRVDENNVLWNSRVLTPIIPINLPSTIVDLRAEIISTNSVLLKWTAPEGNEGDVITPSDRYIIYVTESYIGEDTSESLLNGIKPYVQTIIPKTPGTEEEFIVNKLIPGRKYYITIRSDKTLKGKTRVSLKSNVIDFYTAFNSIDKTTTSSIIQLDPNKVFIYFLGMTYNNDTEDHINLSPVNLTDLTGIVDSYGTPVGVPTTQGMETSQWGDPYGKGWFNFDYPEVIFDLGGAWNLDKIYVYIKHKDMPSTARNYKIKGSSNGTDWNLLALDQVNYTDPLDTWTLIELDQDYTSNVKYVSFGIMSNSYIDGMVMYGTRLEPEIISGIKLKAPINNRTIKQRSGINCFYAEENVSMMSEISTVTRAYNEGQWFMADGFRDAGEFVNAPTENDQKFNFATSFMWNYDDKLLAWKNTGQENLLCISSSPPFLRTVAESTGSGVGAELIPPVDPGVNIGSLSTILNPSNYKYYSRLCYNVAARYGSTPISNTQYIQLQNGELLRTGTNLVKYVEPGNEVERSWHGQYAFSNAEELAVRYSAAYDGHKGLLPGGGFKTADPNITVLTSGYVQGVKGQTFKIMKWCDKNRGLGDYPFDVINYHWYSRWELEPGSAMWSTQPMHGICPERKSTIDTFKNNSEFRSTYMPNKEVWITEMGYDEQRGGTNSPPHTSQRTRSLLKGAWLMRSLLLAFHYRVDVVTLYWWANTTVRLEDLNPESNIRDTFLTCGITDGVIAYNDWNRKWIKSGYYLKEFLRVNGGFRLKHNIVYKGVRNTTTTIVDSADPSLFAFALEHPDGSKAIILWMIDTVLAYKTVRIRVSNTESSINTVNYHSLYETNQAAEEVYSSSYDGENYYIEVPVGELPVTVYTTNIGIGKLSSPEDIKTQALSKSAIKLAWKDINIGNNNTVIYQSESPIENFTIIYNGYIDNGEFTVNGLNENTSYYYRIQFQNGASFSDISAVYGNQTLFDMPVPSNFRSGIVTTSSIQLLWDLTNEQQQLIDSFNLYRATSSGGPYTKIQTFPAHIRNFTDLGLLTGTTYYYKINTSYEDIVFSDYSFVLEQTTNTPSEESPIVAASKINYLGDKIYLRMDMDVKDAAGSELAFTIIKNGVDLIPVTAASVGTVDKGLVTLLLNERVKEDDVITVSYDYEEGFIKSLEGFPLDSFEDLIPENHANDSDLFVQRIGFNILNAAYPAERPNFSQSGWNNSFQNFSIPWEVQMQGELINMEGELTGYRFFIPFRGNGDILQRWSDTPQNPNVYTGDDSQIVDVFPTNTRKSGQLTWGTEKRGWKISNLNPNSIYNIYVHITSNEEVDTFTAIARTINGAHQVEWVTNKNTLNYGVLSDMSPGSYSFGSVGSSAFEYNPLTQDYALTESPVIEGPNNIALHLTHSDKTYERFITAIIVEELNKLNI